MYVIMAPEQILCLSLFLLSLHTSGGRESSGLIDTGSSLYANSSHNLSWLSPSGHFAFGFYPQGGDGLFAVGIWLVNNPNDTTVVWTYNADDPPVPSDSVIEFTRDGQLLLHLQRDGQHDEITKPIVELDKDEAGVLASMLDSGNFVIYNRDSQVIWGSSEHQTDTLLGGHSLSTRLTSSKSQSDHSRGRFYLEVDGYGNLVAYPENHSHVPEEIYYSIPRNKSYPGSNVHLNLSRGGVLQLSISNQSLQILASSSYSDMRSETVIYRATLDWDGIFRLYSHRFKANGISNVNLEWSALQNQCQVKGFCGFNSFCSGNTTKADCNCFTGFEFIDRDIKFLGCHRRFSDEQGCERKDPASFYNMSTFKNTKLGGFPYALLSVNYREDCSKSCLDDCYCGAALYSNKTCSKLRLPLMFGVENENESATVFIKWNSGTSPLHHNPPVLDNGIMVTEESKKRLIRILAASLSSMTFLCFIIAASSLLAYKLRMNRYRKLPGNSSLGLTREFTIQSFAYNELDQATNGFKEELGRGRFGAVYKGSMFEGKRIIAVKRLENPGENGEDKFRAEMAAVRRTHHRNLVRMLGFCMEGSRKLLVYEYMSRGSLAHLLFHAERRPLWKERVRIALEVARGILYLHEECEVQMIHCDINPKNILIDDSWTAKISNFSSAKLLMPNQTETISKVGGTRGYVAPEWQKNSLITVKADVYSYGVVLLEIVCCRSNMEVSVSTADEVLLSTWVYKCFIAGELNKLVKEEDEEGEVDRKRLERMVKIGLLCIQEDRNLRPSMKNVILMLEGTMDVLVPPFPTASLVIT